MEQTAVRCCSYLYTWQTGRKKIKRNERLNDRMSTNSKEGMWKSLWQRQGWGGKVGEQQEQAEEMREWVQDRQQERRPDASKGPQHTCTNTDTLPRTHLHLPLLAVITDDQNRALSEKSLCSCKLLSTNRQLQALVALAICFFLSSHATFHNIQYSEQSQGKGQTIDP